MQTFTAKQYLKIDIANNFGLDKLSWQDRLAWFEANKKDLMNQLTQAENPALFYAGIKAWNEVERGLPTGYPISLDATSSGIQILAVLTGDRNAALLSNVLDAGKRNDAYTEIYELMQQKVGNANQLSRKPVKQAVMTSFYGSMAVPRDVFGEGPLLAAFYQTLEEATPAAWELNKFLLESWNPEALEYAWILPDDYHVIIKVIDEVQETVEFAGEKHVVTHKENRPIKEGRSLGANLVHSLDGMLVRELVARCDYCPERIQELRMLLREGPGAVQEYSPNAEMVARLWELYLRSGFLSARILDYLDLSSIHLVDRAVIGQLLDSLPKKPFKVVPVHDCFRVHPNYGNDLRKQYNLLLSLLAKSNILSYLLSQILGKPIPISKVGSFADEILDANYALS